MQIQRSNAFDGPHNTSGHTGLILPFQKMPRNKGPSICLLIVIVCLDKRSEIISRIDEKHCFGASGLRVTPTRPILLNQ